MKKTNIFIFSLLLFFSFSSAFALDKGSEAPAFTLKNIKDNQSVSLSDYAGKVVYLDFWASWCAPCRGSFPLLNKLYAKLKDRGVEIVGVNLDEDDEELAKFMSMYPVDFTLVRDAEGDVPEMYEVAVMPSSFIIDQHGKVQFSHQGFRDEDIDTIEKHINDLLANKSLH